MQLCCDVLEEQQTLGNKGEKKLILNAVKSQKDQYFDDTQHFVVTGLWISDSGKNLESSEM